MTAAERDNSWKGRQHKTLRDWLGQPDLVTQIAEEQAQALISPQQTASAQQPVKTAEVVEIRAGQEKKPPPVAEEKQSDHGRLLLFRPAQVKVVIVREEVGRAWDGTKIHEVVDNQGKRFLASEKQLQPV